ncbi:TPA: hypothetical protein DCG86_00780 [Candidatus Marinimicrobia bacterium]|nr:MAG: UDP-N-acetylglucosamine-N-acetylmuramyl-(pentapeptide) pyrophosphoryl-undecaprenol N-acetylglucosamine transferase [Marinimicrobia bacterium 46_43]HAE86539.1 hypothetical protein [Candidatus Neomarinimicrobiota bacterium]HBY18659.1 hypothetical protein [Candidatus Neomarinimicrobiota bacterium]
MTGGGTGGHYFPAVAIARELKRVLIQQYPGYDIRFFYIGSALGIEANRDERGLFHKKYTIPIKGVARSLYKGAVLNNLKFPFRLLKSVWMVKRLFTSIKPDLVIATGGYVSGVPGREAIRRKIPLYIQEQNAWPGITTKILVKHARILFYAYEDVLSHLDIHPGTRLIQTPNPVRSTLKLTDKPSALNTWNLKDGRKTLFVFGGSQGSLNMNREVSKNAEAWVKDLPLQILWQTGPRHYDLIRKDFEKKDHIHLHPFIEDMGTAYAAADLILCRAGALTLAELEYVKKPAILIPLPSSAANHQFHNAKAFEKRGIAVVITEDRFEEGALDTTVRQLIARPEILEDLTNHFPETIEDGLSKIVQHIVEDLPF